VSALTAGARCLLAARNLRPSGT